jgi:putative ABC transport system permease protein
VRSVYGVLLRLYPRAFRQQYGPSLLDAFETERSDPRHRGLRGFIALWRFLLVDAVTAAWRLHTRTVPDPLRGLRRRTVPRLPDPPKRGCMETLVQDVRYSFRQFVRRPGFTALAVLSLALAIGGNSLIFGLLDGFVFNPFRYPDADRLVAIGVTFPKVSSEINYVEVLSPAEYTDIRTARSFAATGAFDLGNRNVSGGDVPERVFTAFLLDDLFPVIGLEPHLGRGFSAEELAPGGPKVAVVSYRLWLSRFGGDPSIVGRAIRVGGTATTVVGVMPRELVLIGADLWLPWGGSPADVPRAARQFTILARLAPGVSVTQANAELAAIAGQVQQAHVATLKEYEGWRLTATPWAAALLQDLRAAAFVILCAVGVVLLIACANLTNLMLARATTRTREIAVRLALGAARWRIARQLLTESLMLATTGTLLGLVIAYVGLQFAPHLVPQQFQTLGLQATVNLRVLGWSAALALAAALLIALLPALQATRTDPHDSLKSEARTGGSRAGGRLRQGLVVAEVALSVVLLLGAGLLMRSFSNLQRADLGFDPAGVLTMRLTLPQQKYPTNAAMTAFFEELTRRVQAVPGVTSAATVSQFPPSGAFNSQIEVEGVPPPGTTLPSAMSTIASRDYFRTVGIPVIRGRSFTAAEDTPAAPRRAIVNQAFVVRHMKDRDPLSTRVRLIGRGGPGEWIELVGVVGDARNNGAGAPVMPEIFIPMEQGRDSWNQLFLLVRSAGDANAPLSAVRAAVSSIDPEQPVYLIRTMEDAVAMSAFQQRIAAVLLGIFAAVALILAAIGIYGVMSYSVSARTQEIGVRMAIGAESADVLRLILRQVGALAAIGLALGTGLLLLAGPALRGLLFGVQPTDALTIGAVTVTLGAVALIAGWIPARRASRINPIEALRYQ